MATTSIGASGVVFPDATTQATAGGTGITTITTAVSPGTWTKPATVKSIKVTVVGGGGSGGAATSPGPNQPTTANGGGGGGAGAAIRTYPAASLPGPQPYTVGGIAATSSFGVAPVTVVSATGGATAATTSGFGAGGAGGVGSNGNFTLSGEAGIPGSISAYTTKGTGGSSYLGTGSVLSGQPVTNTPGFPGSGYGGGGSGGCRQTTGVTTSPGGAGAAGVVIIEEFY